MLPEGWVQAGLLNSHVSSKCRPERTDQYKDNKYVFWKYYRRSSLHSFDLSWCLLWLILIYPESIYRGIISCNHLVIAAHWNLNKTRCYMWLAISRSYRHDLRRIVSNDFYAIHQRLCVLPLFALVVFTSITIKFWINFCSWSDCRNYSVVRYWSLFQTKHEIISLKRLTNKKGEARKKPIRSNGNPLQSTSFSMKF